MAFTQPRICPVIVGRERELAFGARLLDEAAGGQSTFLLLAGEAGVGKSRLLRELTADADAFAALGQIDAAREALVAAHALAAERGPRVFLWRTSAAHATLEKRAGHADRALFTRARRELETLLACLPDAHLRETMLQTSQARALAAIPERTTEPDQLTRRERQVVAQIAQGKSNREIADILFIAEKTVETHITNSLSKLGYHSRAQLAVWSAAQVRT